MRVCSELAFVVKVCFFSVPLLLPLPESTFCAWTVTSKRAGFVYGASAEAPSWVHLFSIAIYLIKTTLQPWTQDTETWCFSGVSLFGGTLYPVSLLPFQFLFSLLKGVSVLYGNWADIASMWEIFLSSSKAPEDIIMEVALERGIENGSSCQGYADSSGDRLPFQTHDPPPPTRALFFTK